MSRLLVAVDDECQREALETVLECMLERKVTIERREQVDEKHVIDLSWVRRDSPKRQACLSLRTRLEAPFPGMTDEQIVEALVPTVRMSLTDDVTLEQLQGWMGDLRGVAIHAATCNEEIGLQGPSGSGWCLARTPSPWLPGQALRTCPEDHLPHIVTLDEAGLLEALPDLPCITLFESTEITRKGVSRVNIRGLVVSARHREVTITERMRLAARYGEYRPPT